MVDATAEHHVHEEHATIRTYTIVFAALVALLLLTVIAGAIDLGRINVLIAMTIAVIKAVLVIMYFMHVKYSGRLVWIFSSAAFLWLGILLVLTASDYLSRGWVPRRLEEGALREVTGTSPRSAVRPTADPGTRTHEISAEDITEIPPSTTRPVPPQPRGRD